MYDDAIKQKGPVKTQYDDIDGQDLLLNPVQLMDNSDDNSSIAGDDCKVPLVTLLRMSVGDIIEEYLEPQNPAILDEDAPLEQFMELIRARKLRSCLVRYNSGGCCGFGKRMAFIDVRDVSYHLVRMFREWRARTTTEILTICRRTPVGRVANISKRSPFNPVSVTATCSELCAAFGSSSRIPIVNQKGNLVRIMSPVDLLRVLRQARVFLQIQQLAKLAKLLTPAMRPVECLTETDSFLKGASMMERHNISALPIVEFRSSSLVIRDVLTVTDVQRVFEVTSSTPSAQVDVLNAPALNYVSLLRREQPSTLRPKFLFLRTEPSLQLQSLGGGTAAPLSSPSAVPTDNGQEQSPLPPDYSGSAALSSSQAHMREILQRFADTSVSRLFILNDQGLPTQMVTLTDVMRLLAGHLGNPSLTALLLNQAKRSKSAAAAASSTPGPVDAKSSVAVPRGASSSSLGANHSPDSPGLPNTPLTSGAASRLVVDKHSQSFYDSHYPSSSVSAPAGKKGPLTFKPQTMNGSALPPPQAKLVQPTVESEATTQQQAPRATSG